MARLALRLLTRARAGHVTLRRETLRGLFDVADDSSVRKYLARMRQAGVLDYRAGRESVAIWFLAWVEADDRPRRARSERQRDGRARDVAEMSVWSEMAAPAANNGAASVAAGDAVRVTNGAARGVNGAAAGLGGAPWDR